MVVTVDMPGRGQSDWVQDSQYSYPLYMEVANSIFSALGNPTKISWIGTSMGGLLGMMISSMKDSPIEKMVLVDIGPFVPVSSLKRIAGYVGKDPMFDSIEEYKSYLQNTYTQMGNLTDKDWNFMAERMHRKVVKEGKELIACHYDPKVFQVDPEQLKDLDIWMLWDNIQCDVYTLRGKKSDVLPAYTFEEMQTRGPKSQVIEFEDCGHTPHLFSEEKCKPVIDFLRN